MYDVSSFIAKHPGGMEQIMMGAGRDITVLFESYHPFNTYKLVYNYEKKELNLIVLHARYTILQSIGEVLCRGTD